MNMEELEMIYRWGKLGDIRCVETNNYFRKDEETGREYGRIIYLSNRCHFELFLFEWLKYMHNEVGFYTERKIFIEDAPDNIFNFKFFLDLDIKNVDLVPLTHINELIFRFLLMFEDGKNSLQWIITTSCPIDYQQGVIRARNKHGSNYVGLHVIFQNVIVTSSHQDLLLLWYIKRSLEASDKVRYMAKALDRTDSLRLPKPGHHTPFLSSESFPNYIIEPWTFPIMRSCSIRIIETPKLIVSPIPLSNVPTNDQLCEMFNYVPGNVGLRVTLQCSNDFMYQLRDFIAEKFGEQYRKMVLKRMDISSNNNIVYIRSNSKYCQNIQQEHASNHIYWAINNDVIYQKCFDTGKAPGCELSCKVYQSPQVKLSSDLRRGIEEAMQGVNRRPTVAQSISNFMSDHF